MWLVARTVERKGEDRRDRGRVKSCGMSKPVNLTIFEEDLRGSQPLVNTMGK